MIYILINQRLNGSQIVKFLNNISENKNEVALITGDSQGIVRGIYINPSDVNFDLQEMVDKLDHIIEENIYTLRLPTLDGSQK